MITIKEMQDMEDCKDCVLKEQLTEFGYSPEDCRYSLNACGHHCNHFVVEKCCWCGKVFPDRQRRAQ